MTAQKTFLYLSTLTSHSRMFYVSGNAHYICDITFMNEGTTP